MTTIRAQGFASPTPIQCQAWPMALSGRDVVAIAQTGSGKTISFALPGMLHINAYAPRSLQHSALNIFAAQATFARPRGWPHRPDSGPYSRTGSTDSARVHKIRVSLVSLQISSGLFLPSQV